MKSVWVIDSGCSQFICNDISQLVDIVNVNIVVRLGDKSTVYIEKAGVVNMFNHSFYCLYAPSFRISLISVPVLDDCGFTCVFEDKKVIIMLSEDVLGVARLWPQCDLYLFDPTDSFGLLGTPENNVLPPGDDIEMEMSNTIETAEARTDTALVTTRARAQQL